MSENSKVSGTPGPSLMFVVLLRVLVFSLLGLVTVISWFVARQHQNLNIFSGTLLCVLAIWFGLQGWLQGAISALFGWFRLAASIAGGYFFGTIAGTAAGLSGIAASVGGFYLCAIGAYLVIGLLGRLDRVKDQRGAIEACAILRRAGRQVRLMLLGEGTSNISRAAVESWIAEAGLSGLAVVTGRREDVPACISAMDVGVVPSLGSETIARAALEIMACGRPLIGATVGVMPDLLPAEGLFAPGNPSAMAEKIAKIINDPTFAASLLADAAKRMPSLSGPAFMEKTLQVYQQAVSAAGIPL